MKELHQLCSYSRSERTLAGRKRHMTARLYVKRTVIATPTCGYVSLSMTLANHVWKMLTCITLCFPNSKGWWLATKQFWSWTKLESHLCIDNPIRTIKTDFVARLWANSCRSQYTRLLLNIMWFLWLCFSSISLFHCQDIRSVIQILSIALP